MLRVLDLFSGIGGFSLGLERTGGFRTVAFCEIEPYARAVLAKHWPGVPCFEDVRTITAADVGGVDVICGGFPCQDISQANLAGQGLAGERSGLWREFARLIGELRPVYAVVENVAALTFRGLLDVLGDLSEIGYDAEWHCIRASAVGLPHGRERIWIIAYPAQERREGAEHGPRESDITRRLRAQIPATGSHACTPQQFRDEVRAAEFVRTSNGIPGRTHRIAALGNAVVPQIPEIIGRAILEAEMIYATPDGRRKT